MSGTGKKKKYSEKELDKILSAVKPTIIENPEVRLQKLENSLQVVFSAISEIKAELNELYGIVGQGQELVEEGILPTKTKKVSRREAAKIIHDYILKNPGCRTSEILSALQIDPDIVLDVLRSLSKKGKVRNERIVR